ncbi:alpha/beta hydrolase fold protein [Methanobacterium lacus]|uniref:Alpha/beta hydrolase fold protein n=1 Tax=Methanobacterium lacus (strain AL-21) TaxID=877455 RepID=F0TBF9_METLA|nr:alpha/beta hydrolase [Methanobacterium lacus]ADZ10228.1 alpha/beta hydrolase fold protein [Methanobacterium lacus]
MSYINSHYAQIYYNTHGKGDPTIFLHGLSDSSQFFKPLKNNITGIKAIQPDLRGHGESDHDVDISMELLTEDLINLLNELHIKRANILGFSLGSLIAQNFALEFPEHVKSLIICSGYSKCGHELSETFKKLEDLTSQGGVPAFFDEMIKLVYTKDYLLKHREIYGFKDMAVQTNSKAAVLKSLSICRTFDVESRLSEINVPTLIMYGSEDILVPPESSQKMHCKLTHSRILSFPMGHNFFLQENIKKIAVEIQKFLI